MGKNPIPPPLPREPGKLHLDYKMHPHFLSNWGGASYSLKNMVFHSAVISNR